VQRGLLTHDPQAAGTPILLLHGVIGNRSSFVVLRRLLRRRGFHRVVAVNYQVLTHDVRSAAGLLAGEVTALCEATGCERVHIVAHSLGGVIARYYVQRLGGDARVHTLVTLGSPHQGTSAAGLVPHPVCRQLRPGSDLIGELDEPAPACRTRFVAFWSDLDLLMLPKHAAQVSHPDLAAENVLARGVGHLAMLVDGAIAHRIAATLAQLEPTAPGVSPPPGGQPVRGS
ncbi:MAG TPA: alpha/beta fold hydrolase, partial [Frankiaceae bacterium]|nr:alpha/beta fold hydrolase [Frankiaceae bacterium]